MLESREKLNPPLSYSSDIPGVLFRKSGHTRKKNKLTIRGKEGKKRKNSLVLTLAFIKKKKVFHYIYIFFMPSLKALIFEMRTGAPPALVGIMVGFFFYFE